MAEAYSCRPSDLLGIEDPYSAWCMDEAAFTWGMAVDSAVSRARHAQENVELKEAAATAELERLLSEPKEEGDEPVVSTGKFRDPAADFAAALARRK